MVKGYRVSAQGYRVYGVGVQSFGAEVQSLWCRGTGSMVQGQRACVARVHGFIEGEQG